MKRRFKIYWVSLEAMLRVFQFHHLPMSDRKIPYGVEPVTAFFEPIRQCFGIILYHPSFPEIAEGELISELN